MKVGTKSLLYGVHHFMIHPITVFIAWCKLYGFPKDPRIWIAFIVHDWGYWGKSNIDGKEGETHVELGANIMHKLFDTPMKVKDCGRGRSIYVSGNHYWYNFTIFHSRFYAEKYNHKISKLCIADKYAFCILPKWLYIILASWSGEIDEYMTKGRSNKVWTSKSNWHDHVYDIMKVWIEENKNI
jgi:hypothetical protein